MKSGIVIIVFLLFLLLLFSSCNSVDPPPPKDEKPVLELKLEDVSCIEAWIELTITNFQPPATISLNQNNQTRSIINLVKADTLLYIDSLLPNQNYSFHAAMQPSNNADEVKSNVLSVTTLDTTSHNFTFQTWTLGDLGSSVLYDAAIIDENNIWAVGEIFINDTSKLGYTKYNAMHWDGSNWELKRIYYYGACSVVEYPPLKAIWAFAENNIVITNGGSIGWFDGNTVDLDCRVNSLLTGAINKIWGSSNNDLYVVGNNGNIARYNGSQWSRIESGTVLNINDIWGDYNEKTNEWEILAVASNIFSGFEKEVIKINHLNSQILSRDGIDETLSSVWFKANIKYYVVGSGTYKKNKLSDAIWEGDPLDITNYFENRIRANDINDVFVAGAFGELLHFNGVRWQSYLNETGLFNGAYLSVGIKNNILVAVGYEAAQAKIIVGNRE